MVTVRRKHAAAKNRIHYTQIMLLLLLVAALRAAAALRQPQLQPEDGSLTETRSLRAGLRAQGSFTNLAASFENSKCRAALANEFSMANWIGITRPRHSRGLADHQEAPIVMDGRDIVYPGRDLLYIRNQKVASEYIVRELANGLFVGYSLPASSLLSETIVPFEAERVSRGEVFPEQQGEARPVVWTVVRDPVETVVDAYLEISFRAFDRNANSSAKADETPGTWRDMPCASRSQAERRMHAFLDAVAAREPMGTEAFHIYPQALKINAVTPLAEGVPRFDAIIPLEQLTPGLEWVANRAGTTAHIAPPGTQEAHSDQSDVCGDVNVSTGSELARRISQMYEVDYTCLFPQYTRAPTVNHKLF